MSKRTAETPVIDLTVVEGWADLEAAEQQLIQTETAAIRSAIRQEAESKLAIGQHLMSIREVLEPRKMWVAFLRTSFSWSVATAYRYIDQYVAASKKLPKPFMEIAMTRGVSLSLKTIEHNPPPKTDDPIKINEYFENMEKAPRQEPEAESPEELLKECIHFVGTRWDRLSNNKRTRSNFKDNLLGMLLTKFGVANDQTISPIAVPDKFRVARGRPRLVA